MMMMMMTIVTWGRWTELPRKSPVGWWGLENGEFVIHFGIKKLKLFLVTWTVEDNFTIEYSWWPCQASLQESFVCIAIISISFLSIYLEPPPVLC